MPELQPCWEHFPVQENACSLPTWWAEGGRGLCKGEVRTALATSLVSARGQALAQTTCLSPAGPAQLPLSPSRKSQHDSELPGPGERGALPTPIRMCQWTHTHIAQPNPYGWWDSQRCALLGLILGGGQAKQCVDKVQSRVVRGTQRRSKRSVLHQTDTIQTCRNAWM